MLLPKSFSSSEMSARSSQLTCLAREDGHDSVNCLNSLTVGNDSATSAQASFFARFLLNGVRYAIAMSAFRYFVLNPQRYLSSCPLVVDSSLVLTSIPTTWFRRSSLQMTISIDPASPKSTSVEILGHSGASHSHGGY